MQNRVPQFRLRSLTGLALISGFSLVVWVLVAMGMTQLAHGNHPACDHPAATTEAASQGCKPER